MSKEHIVPQWVSKIIVPHANVPHPVTVRKGSDTAPPRVVAGADVINVVMKRVCKVCNEGWMEQRLESPCQKVLPAMLRGQQTILDRTAQSVLASWAAKTAMVGRYAHMPPGEIEPQWLDHMYRYHEPPPGWHVWLTGYAGTRYLLYDAKGGSLPGSRVKKVDGVVMSLLIGHVLLKVLGFPIGLRPREPRADLLFRIWPVTEATHMWPMKNGVVSDHHMQDFVAMWGPPGDPMSKLPDES